MTTTSAQTLRPWLVLAGMIRLCAWLDGDAQAAGIHDVTTVCDAQVTPAIPDDGLDDAAGIQACIDAIATDGGGVLYFPPGTYDVKRATTAACATQSCSLNITGVDNMTIRGDGPISVVRKIGAGAGSGSDWWMWRGGDNENLSVHDLTIDGNAQGITDVGEQTHEFNFHITGVGSATRVRFDRMYFHDSAGDCIRTVGNHVGDVAEEFIVANSWFDECKRGAIGVQRGVRHYVITGNVMIGGTDQQIDFEPSSNGPVERFTISNNVIAGTGSTAVALAGSSFDVHEQSTFTGNFVLGRVFMFQNANLVVSNNVMMTLSGNSDPAVDFRKTQDGVVVSGNVIVRGSLAAAGPALRVTHHNSGFAQAVLVTGNRILQQTNSTGITVISAERAAVSDNLLMYTGSPNVGAGINFTTTLKDALALSVVGNVLVGPWFSGVQFAPSPNDIETLTVAMNLIHGPSKGVLLNTGTGDYVNDPMIYGNSIQATTPIAAGQLTYATGGNSGAHVQLNGYGVPVGGCSSGLYGSMYVNRQPGAFEGLYLCTSSGWKMAAWDP